MSPAWIIALLLLAVSNVMNGIVNMDQSTRLRAIEKMMSDRHQVSCERIVRG